MSDDDDETKICDCCGKLNDRFSTIIIEGFGECAWCIDCSKYATPKNFYSTKPYPYVVFAKEKNPSSTDPPKKKGCWTGRHVFATLKNLEWWMAEKNENDYIFGVFRHCTFSFPVAKRWESGEGMDSDDMYAFIACLKEDDCGTLNSETPSERECTYTIAWKTSNPTPMRETPIGSDKDRKIFKWTGKVKYSEVMENVEKLQTKYGYKDEPFIVTSGNCKEGRNLYSPFNTEIDWYSFF